MGALLVYAFLSKLEKMAEILAHKLVKYQYFLNKLTLYER